MKRNEWSDSRIIMPFVPLESIKEELTPCSSTQRLENNLSLIKNKLRSGSDAPPAPVHRDQRTQLYAETNTSVANCLNLNVIHANRVTNLNYNARNNLYNIKSKIRKSSSRTSVNDARLSNIDSSRDASESNDEIYTRSANIGPVKPARKSVNTRNEKTISGHKNSAASSAKNGQRNDVVVSKNSTPRSMKYNSCIDELKYYNVRNGLSKNPSEQSSATRKVNSQCEDDELSRSNSGLTTGRTDCTDISVFNNKENTRESKENSSGNCTTTLNDNEKNNSLDLTDMSECNTKDFKHYLMHSDNKISSTTNSMNLTESEPNSPDIPTDTSVRVKQHESTRGIKPKSAQERTRIPKKERTDKVVNKNPLKDLPGNGLKYKIGVPQNKPNVNRNDLGIGTKKVRAKSDDASSHSTKIKSEVKAKEAKYRTQKAEDICTSSKTQPVEKPLKNSTQTKVKQDSSKITKTTIDSKDIGENSTRKKNSTIRRRYSMGESSVTNQERHKKILEPPRAEEKTRRTTTYMDDNQKRQKENPPTDLQAEMTRRNDDDCYSKPSDFSLKSSDSLHVLERRVDCCPSTDYIRDNSSQMSDNSKVRRDILERTSTNLLLRQRDADDRHLGMGDFSEYSFGTMDYCAACNNYSDLSTQDSFSTNTKDTWTQVHFSDIVKEMKRQMKKDKTAAEEEVEYSSFMKRHDNNKNRTAMVRNERTGQYRRGREMNFNYDKPVENYLINSSRQNSVTRYAHDDDMFDCCGCMRFSFFRRIFNRLN
ncbi:hypothetical protein CBL_07711 [Carabus blaptoides fortunei]